MFVRDGHLERDAPVAMPEWQAGVLDRTSAGTSRPQ
jgi:hypothetical protein